MSVFQQEVKKRIGPYMKAKGFRLRGRRYYYIKNDIAYCISFEQPTGWMYTWAHVNPLYVPHDFIFLSYGNRLNNMADIRLPTLGKGLDSTEIDDWCELFIRSMDEHILPFFQQIDTPKKLIAYIDTPDRERRTGRMCCPPLWGDKLRMYTYLYSRDFSMADAAATVYKQTAGESSYLIASLREKLQKEADEFKLLIAQGDEAVDAFCKQTIADTKKLFQKPK